MTEYKTDNKLGVGEILICNKETNGKLEPLKYFIGKVIINIGGGGEKMYVIEEKEKISSEVKSITSRSNFRPGITNNNNVSVIDNSTINSKEVNVEGIASPKINATQAESNNKLRSSKTMGKDANVITNRTELNNLEDVEALREGSGQELAKNFKRGQTKEFEEGIKTSINNNLHDIKEIDEMKEEMDELNTDLQQLEKAAGGNNNNNIKSEKISHANRLTVIDNGLTQDKIKALLKNHTKNIITNHLSQRDYGASSNNNLELANNNNFVYEEPYLNNNEGLMNIQSTHNLHSNNEIPISGHLEHLGILDDPIQTLNHNNLTSEGEVRNENFSDKENKEKLINKENLIKEKDGGSQISNNTKYTNDFNSNKNLKLEFTDKESQIIQIVRGKHHLLKLTMDGKVFGSGQSYFGVVGLGGSQSSEKSVVLPNLAKIKIVQIACGMFHSLALSLNGDLFTWGMGFEGQLGLTATYKVASSPRYVNFFYKKPVKFICCGHNYSLCITNDARLWGWGENKLGQLGLGKTQIVDKPTHIEINDLPGNQEGINKVDSILSGGYEREYTGKPLNPCYISAGFAHTAVVTDEGYLLTFGLNIYGQLGLGNTTSTFEPKLIDKDNNGDNIGKVVRVCCNVNGTFIITEEGRLYTCGSGEIGHGDMGVVKLPRLISDSRVYKHVFCNDSSILAFCPLRILSISPACGPASGNTILSIIGSALKEFPKLSVRFIFGGVARDVKATFDKISRTIFVRTPNFIDLCPNLELPSACKVQLTFDGHYFTEYEDSFLIYPSNIKLTGIEPKCGPTIGGSQLQIKINLDGISFKYLFSLTCGFQAKPIVVDPMSKLKGRAKHKLSQSLGTGTNKTVTGAGDNLEDSKLSSNMEEGIAEKEKVGTLSHGKDNNTSYIIQATAAVGNNINNTNINPMDFANIESQLDKANWYCCFATYENGVMTCNIPKIQNFNQNQVEYNVDVAINGQQFTGYPMIYRFYDIKVDKMEPNISSLEGGLLIKIFGTGLFDSLTKKAKISSSLGERYSDLQWDRIEKTLILNSNPLHWITNDEDVIKNISPGDLYENYSFDVHITMNNIEWIYAGAYRYCDPKITRVVYHSFADNVSKEDRQIHCSTQEFLTNDEKIFLGLVPFPDDKKKKDEMEKKKAEEDNMINNVYKRPYTGLALYGNFFPNTHLLKVKFVSQNSEVDAIAFYKNKYKIMCLVPEMYKLNPGQHELKLMVSLNSQQFFAANKNIMFNCPEFGLKFEDIVKDDEKGKKGAKPGGKK